MWKECMKVNMIRFDLVKDDSKWRSFTTENRPTLSQYGNEGVILYVLRSRNVKR